MDLSCPRTVQNEILQKFRETIPLVGILFQIWIIFDRFEVIVKNLSQHLKFWPNFGCFLRLSPQDDVRIIFQHPDYLIYFRVHNSPASFVQIGWIISEWLFKLHQNTQFLKILQKSVG